MCGMWHLNVKCLTSGRIKRERELEGLKGLSIHLGTTTNNTTELEVVCFGLNLAWNLGFKHINFQQDSTLVIQ